MVLFSWTYVLLNCWYINVSPGPAHWVTLDKCLGHIIHWHVDIVYGHAIKSNKHKSSAATVVEGLIIIIHMLPWWGRCLFCPSGSQLLQYHRWLAQHLFSVSVLLCWIVHWRQHGLLASCGAGDCSRELVRWNDPHHQWLNPTSSSAWLRKCTWF